MKVLIVEDHPIVRSGLRRMLAAEAEEEIREAANGQEALAIFKAWRPAVTVLDLNLPGLGGLGVIERLKAADPDARIVVLSMHDDPMHVTRALQAGASGYVTKNAQPSEITDAVRRVARGRTYVEHAIAEELVFSSIHPQLLPLTELSTREIEVLRLLAQGRRLSEIAETVGISQKTAANSCSRIKAKLGAASTADLVRIALRSGLIDRDADLSDLS
ncbi:MAG TPA: response regulator transcription factor [Stellaceae bacterium]|nr:response regulator transcription factor [Stellaceae bacterium]